MKLLTREQSQKLEAEALNSLDLTSVQLMETAGALAASEIASQFPLELKAGLTLIACGRGHNGGDGFVVARHLYDRGFRHIEVWVTQPLMAYGELEAAQIKRLRSVGISIFEFSEDQTEWTGRKPTLVVDALFGIGLNRKLNAEDLRILKMINQLSTKVVSLDLPSGIDADTGLTWGGAIKANLTLCFLRAKPGLYLCEGPSHSGRVKVLPLGTGSLTSKHPVFLMTAKLARKMLPRRKSQSHKAKHGRLLVIAGRKGTWGAAILASSAAYRAGAGYVTLASFDQDLSSVIGNYPEVLTTSLGDLGDLSRFSAILVGPGLGVSADVEGILLRIQKEFTGPVIVDADALTVLSERFQISLRPNWILTPHPGEFSRLTGLSVEEIESDRLRHAQQSSQRWNAIVCLKGYRTVVASSEKSVIIHAGNAALAKAGTGDVLAGFVGSFCAQGLPPMRATCLGAFLHGSLSDLWIHQQKDVLSLQPSDLGEGLPGLINEIRHGIRG